MDILIGVVTGSEVSVNRDGTVPGRLLQVVATDLQDVQTVEMSQDGEELNPIPGSRVLIAQAGPSCKMALRVDDGVEPIMPVGGKRIYSLAEDGAVKAEVRLYPDGTVMAMNGNGSFTMNPDGTFNFHGTGSTFDHDVTVQGKITATGDVEAIGTVTGSDVVFGGIAASTHVHGGVTPGSGVSGGPEVPV